VLLYERMMEEQTDLPQKLRDQRKRQARDMFRFADAKAGRQRALAAQFGERIQACGASCDVSTGGDILR
jgi:superfamily II DNA helicase RecQ